MSDSSNGVPGFQPIGAQRIKKSKRTRVILIITILILIAALGGLVYLGYNIYNENVNKTQDPIKAQTLFPDEAVSDENAPGEIKVEETTIPNLASLFGLSLEEAKTMLGDSFQLLKTDEVSDPTNLAIKKLAHFSYSAKAINPAETSMVALPSEDIYVSLDENDKVIDIYYICDMRLLGYPEKSFIELLANGEIVTNTLAAAGVEPRDFGFVAPTEDETISYDNASSENRKVVKQTTLFSGRTTTDAVPTAWTLNVTYDYGSGVTTTSDFRQATRTISLRLA